MQPITITIQAQDAQQAIELLERLDAASKAEVPPESKTKKKTKIVEDGFLDETDSESEEDETEENKTEISQDEVLAAFKEYAVKHSREKAMSILKKLGSKSVRDLPENKYPDAMRLVASR